MLHLVREAGLDDAIHVDSAGTGAWHAGEKADTRSRKVAASRGFDLPSRARQFKASDFEHFDYVLAMDASNHTNLRALAPNVKASDKVSLLRQWDPLEPGHHDVPDPYYGGPRGFDDVFDLCERACEGLLGALVKKHQLTP